MKKSSKERVINTTSGMITTQRYHQTTEYDGNRESYASQGYNNGFYLYTSDRKIAMDLQGNRIDGKPSKGYGLEIELESEKINDSNVLSTVIEKLIMNEFPKDIAKYQHDGSLGGLSNTEMILQPMTRECIRNNYPAFKNMYNTAFKFFGISASKSGNCGMHVNLSTALFGKTVEKQKENIRKLIYFVNKNFELCCGLFLRDRRHTTYCGKMNGLDHQETVKAIENLGGMSASHFNCLNISHFDAGRIEIRLVAGQPSFGGFRNTMETIFFMVDRFNDIAWKDLDNLTKFFSGCNKYVLDRICTVDSLLTRNIDLVTIRNNITDEEYI